MERYKIREEKSGAMLFDTLVGKSVYLNEAEYQEILAGKKNEYSYLFSENGTPLFKLFKPVKDRKSLPADCLSAPSKVYFEITRRCNLKCEYCYNNSRNDFSSELFKDQIIKVVDELYELGTFEIRLTGGEPTLHPHFFEIVKYIEKKGFFISLATNGVWNEELVRKIAATSIRIIIISLDGPEKYHDSVRGKGTFAAVKSTILKLKEYGNFSIKINTVLCRENKEYIEDIISIADSLGIQAVNFAPLRLAGRASKESNHKTVLAADEMFTVVKKITEIRKYCKTKIQTYFDILEEPAKIPQFPSSLLNKKSCAAGIEVAAISPFGEVYGCVVSPANGSAGEEAKKIFTAGDVSEKNFTDIWYDSDKWKVYRDLAYNKSQKCLGCKYYSISCFGNCIVDSYASEKRVNAESPLCFIDLMCMEN